MKKETKTIRETNRKGNRKGIGIQKVKEYLSNFKVDDKVRAGAIKRATGVKNISYILWALKRDGFIDYEDAGRGRSLYITIKTSDRTI
ncbi:MAG: hypothetical protein M1393_04745 [Candidatus Thermoplasmatota archaeon]|nr:hypothetical protein [Candidatus Thermoplasmatota archaeon]